MSTQDFLDTLGVNTHIVYKDGAYANSAAVARDLSYLGIHHVRENVLNHLGPDTASLGDYQALARIGAKFDLVVSYALPTPAGASFVAQNIAMLDTMAAALPKSIVAIEGLNEVNNWPIASYRGKTGVAAALESQTDLYQAVHADPHLRGVAVYDLTGAGQQPSFAGRADFGNHHPYPHNAMQPAAWIAQGFAQAYSAQGAAKRVITEIGNFSLPRDWPAGQQWWEAGAMLGVDEATQAKSILNTYFSAVAQGVSRTYVYELLDEKPDFGNALPSMHYGLFRFDNSPKPSAVAIHNLTAILGAPKARPGVAQPALAYAMAGAPATMQSLLLQKADGRFVLALWNEVPFWMWNGQTSQPMNSAPVPVTVTLAQPATTIRIFDPLLSANPITSAADSRDITVGLTDHPTLVEITAKL